MFFHSHNESICLLYTDMYMSSDHRVDCKSEVLIKVKAHKVLGSVHLSQHESL